MEARPIAPAASGDQLDAFIGRWAASGPAERADFPSFAIELCDLLGVDHPEPARADAALNRYTFEYPVTFRHPDGTTSPGRIDLYRRGRFVMEAKQGSDQQLDEQLALFGGFEAAGRRGTAVRGTQRWTVAMQRARGQAEAYAKALPVEHGWPPFLIVVDVGHCFELYADFRVAPRESPVGIEPAVCRHMVRMTWRRIATAPAQRMDRPRSGSDQAIYQLGAEG